LAGIEIVPNEDWSNVLPGDLLFFGTGERVTHVGISLGGKSFIHQGGKVAINSLDPNSPVFSPYRAKSFMFARRIILPNSTSGRG
jgi:cell wall-associated NlpC family hydrolase